MLPTKTTEWRHSLCHHPGMLWYLMDGDVFSRMCQIQNTLAVCVEPEVEVEIEAHSPFTDLDA